MSANEEKAAMVLVADEAEEIFSLSELGQDDRQVQVGLISGAVFQIQATDTLGRDGKTVQFEEVEGLLSGVGPHNFVDVTIEDQMDDGSRLVGHIRIFGRAVASLTIFSKLAADAPQA